MNTYNIRLVILSLLFLTTSTLVFAQQNYYGSSSKNKVAKVFDIIESYYVEETNDSTLAETAITSILKELDPHSVYIPKKKVKKMNEPLVGNFEGIGIQFNILEDTIVVVSPISGGPSEKLGIQSGDKIIKIEDSVVAGVGYTTTDVVNNLRGQKGTAVNVSIKREGEKKLIDYEIIRDKIPIFSVDASYMATPTVGYIKVNRFSATTSKELEEALQKLKAEGMQDLILDLQNNSGGYLNAAINMADQFLADNKLIVYTEGRKSPRYDAKASSRGLFESGKLVVLVNEGSASASEIVSGAIQDHDRGIIIGRRTFGKGLVQKPFNLPDGSSMRLTVSRYYTPTGRCIQKPYDDGVDAYHKELSTRYKAGELINADSITFPDSLKFYTPNKRVVYGGGGIMPDFFIPLDTVKRDDFYNTVRRKGTMHSFALSYVDKKRKKLLADHPDLASFKNSFHKEEEYLTEFIKFAKKKKIETDSVDVQNLDPILKVQIQALIARNLWDTGAYFEVINELNDAYVRALEVIKDNTFDELKIAYQQ